MRNITLLIKNYFLLFLGNIRGRNNKNKYGAAILILLGGGAVGLFTFINMAILSVQEAQKAGSPESSFYVNAAMAIMFLALMVVMKSAVPSKSNDEELLLSLPIKRSHIIIAKLFYDYIFDLAVVVLTLLPFYIVYYVMVPAASIMIVFRGLIVVLLLPLLSGAIGTLFGLFFQRVASRFKYYGIIQSLLGIIVLILFMYGYYSLNQMITNNQDTSANALYSFFGIVWIVGFVADSNMLYFGYLLLVTVIPYLLIIVLKSQLLGKRMIKYRSKTLEIKYQKRNPTMALYRREVSRYFSCPVYIMNTFFSPLFLLIIGVIISVLGISYITNILDTINLNNLFKDYEILIVILLTFLASLICTTACSVSLEGKNLWIIKAHPIETKKIFHAKIALSLTISYIPIIISSILISIETGIKYLPFFLIIPMIASFAIAVLGLYINLLYPRLDWDNETVPIKQSISTLISVFVGMALGILSLVIYLIFSNIFNLWIILLIMTVIYAAIAAGGYLLLSHKGQKLFHSLNN